MTNDEIVKMCNVESAARVLFYARDCYPGYDLGQEAVDIAMLELRAALAALDELRGPEWRFDAVAALEYLREKHVHK